MKRGLVFGGIIVIFLAIFLIITNLDKISDSPDNNESSFRDNVVENDSNNNTLALGRPIEVDLSCTKEKEECETLGGKWGCKGMICSGNPCNMTVYCNKPTSDAGKTCTDSSQCESYCQAPSNTSSDSGDIIGKCYEYEYADCMSEVRNGKWGGMWCN